MDLNRLRRLRRTAVHVKRSYLRGVWKMDIHPTVEMSLSTRFDKTFPAGVHVGAHSYIAFDVRFMTHDMPRTLRLHTRVGENCFIGGRSIIMPGVQIGDGCIVGAGSVVTRDVEPGSIVAGNPARVIFTGIQPGHYGMVGPDHRGVRP